MLNALGVKLNLRSIDFGRLPLLQTRRTKRCNNRLTERLVAFLRK